ncbi:MAG: rRNA maturation RNase YbeY [Chloroflexi bacterium]|nr:rRNA maturation RNase YbeY [Chloroflexota bacterium]
MFEIDVHCVVDVPIAVVALLKTAVSATLTHENTPSPATLSLVLTDDAQLQQLNNDYRGIDIPTDVLSFAVDQNSPTMPGAAPYLGDIIISVPYATRQANQEGHTVDDELQLLVVHGVLHLLGYDHMERDEKKVMWRRQTAVLQKLNIQITLPDEVSDA